MDSINREQPEHNREDLLNREAVAKIKAMVKSASTCFFCTAISGGKPVATRPMSVQKVDERGSLWFLSASDSHKNQELVRDPNVQLMFQGSQHFEFMTLYGVASVSTDKAMIKELWNPLLKTWFTGGVDDPRITVIEVRPRQGYYWDTKHNRFVALAKMAIGAVIGKTLDDSIEGELRVGAVSALPPRRAGATRTAASVGSDRCAVASPWRLLATRDDLTFRPFATAHADELCGCVGRAHPGRHLAAPIRINHQAVHGCEHVPCPRARPRVTGQLSGHLSRTASDGTGSADAKRCRHAEVSALQAS